MSERDAGQYSPLALAFLGDSVYDTLVRDYLLRRANMPVAKLHTAKIKLVCAEFQSSVYENVAEILTEKEISVLKRGRNSTGNTIPKHAEAVDYRRATAIECLFGYLFLTGQEERISQIFNVIMENVLPEF
ncbi:MAG: ribonuclease III [Ruminococcus sp.]|nr:ribonuclease III [Ruminococcus sp.]MDE6798480.1 ribonuclease III [Ruminococcus sp.]